MCLAKAYDSKGTGEPILQSIQSLKVEGNKIVLQTVFGESKTIQGKVVEVDFSGSRLVIEGAGAADDIQTLSTRRTHNTQM